MSDYDRQHDAQFDLDRVVNYIVELLIRSDAIRHHDRVQNPVPLWDTILQNSPPPC